MWFWWSSVKNIVMDVKNCGNKFQKWHQISDNYPDFVSSMLFLRLIMNCNPFWVFIRINMVFKMNFLLYLQGPLNTAWNAVPKEYSVYVLFGIVGVALLMLLIAKFASR